MDLIWDSTVGRGLFGEVWLAKDMMGRDVAVKFFVGTTPTQAEQYALDHARALARVDHRTVVKVYGVEQQEHPDTGQLSLAILMEFVRGVNLAQRKESIEHAHAIQIANDLVSAVQAIHTAGLVHGDLHEGNVVLTGTGAKVIDLLYTRTLAEVGSKTAHRDRADDIRDLACLVRAVLQKANLDDAHLQEAFYHATRVEDAQGVLVAFAQVLGMSPTASQGIPDATPAVSRVPDAHRSRVLAVIRSLQAGDTSLAACVADTLSIAVQARNDQLARLCEQELAGYETNGGPRLIPESEDAMHRRITCYAALGVELDINQFESGEAAIAWLKAKDERFPKMQIFFPGPIAEVERRATSSDRKKIVAITTTVKTFIPTSTLDDVVTCYAHGDALQEITEKLRALLTKRLLQHLSLR